MFSNWKLYKVWSHIYIYVNCFCNHINYLRNCAFGNTKSIGYLPHATLIHQIIKNNCYVCIFHYVRSQFVTKKIKRFSWHSKIMFPFIRPNFICNKTIPPFIWPTRSNLIFSVILLFFFFLLLFLIHALKWTEVADFWVSYYMSFNSLLKTTVKQIQRFSREDIERNIFL